jgi:hypothetical protein
MRLLFSRLLVCASLAGTFNVAPSFVLGTAANAAQAWSCICDGERKRFLASTRFCEKQSKLAKGKSCGVSQWKSVYGPACEAKGCKLPPLR